MTILDPIYLLLALCTWPIWRRRARGDWGGRLGKGDALAAPRRVRLLVHAVSVGEVNALRSLVPMLADRYDLVISVGTDTGIERARGLYQDRATIVRYPLDFTPCVERFLDRVRPDAVALVELELWPNFLARCRARGIPVGVINGRLSERSFRGYRRLRWFLRRSFASLALAAVQDEDYRARFVAMGVAPERCVVTGSLKWDAPPTALDPERVDALARALGVDRSRPLIVAGSTAEDEESLLRDSCPAGAQLLCAPRRPEHFEDAYRALEPCVRRSTPGEGDPACGRFLLDTIGELALAYALADVVVLGRSFGSLHGSDPLEPAALGRCVVIGPRMGDFSSSVRDLGDAIVRTDRDHLCEVLTELIREPSRRNRLGESARARVLERRGVSERTAALVADRLAPPRNAARR